MKTKKVFVISFNKYTKEFWNQVLDTKNVDLYHWKDYHNGLNNLTTVWPDVVIIEGGLPTKSTSFCVESALQLKCNSKIFWINPVVDGQNLDTQSERLVVSPLTSELVYQINESLNLNAA